MARRLLCIFQPRLGFQHAGRMHSVGRKFGRWLDTIYMQIALGAGDSAPPLKEPQ